MLLVGGRQYPVRSFTLYYYSNIIIYQFKLKWQNLNPWIELYVISSLPTNSIIMSADKKIATSAVLKLNGMAGACSGMVIQWQEVHVLDEEGKTLDNLHFYDPVGDADQKKIDLDTQPDPNDIRAHWSQVSLGDVKAMCSPEIDVSALKSMDDHIHGCKCGVIPRRVTSLHRTFHSTDSKIKLEDAEDLSQADSVECQTRMVGHECHFPKMSSFDDVLQGTFQSVNMTEEELDNMSPEQEASMAKKMEKLFMEAAENAMNFVDHRHFTPQELGEPSFAELMGGLPPKSETETH